MNRFAELLDRLVLTPARNGKIRLLVDYFRAVEDPDRGLALAAITGDLSIAAVKPAMLRALVAERMDPVLFGYSYDYVGDLAETVSLVWPEPDEPAAPQSSDDAWRRGREAAGGEPFRWAEGAGRPARRVGIPARFAIIKLVTGGLRIGVSARLAKQALADFGGVDVGEIEELWHGLTPPYAALFEWLEGKGREARETGGGAVPPGDAVEPGREQADLEKLAPADYSAEWKWDGIRVQVVERARRAPALFAHRRRHLAGLSRSRRGDDISTPCSTANCWSAGRPNGPARSPTCSSGSTARASRRRCASSIRCSCAATTCCSTATPIPRALPLTERREQLRALLATLDPSRFDLSPEIAFADWDALDRLRKSPPHPVIEGVMIKQRQSPYLAGRPKGPWFKWKRDPHTVDAVLMYAQRGHGKRSSYYSDFTFGVWSGPLEESELVPVGKAYFGFTDEELRQLDKYVRDNTVERFGPVRSVRAEPGHGLVLEIAFEGLNRSPRHRSGVAMRFPAHFAHPLGQAGVGGRPHRLPAGDAGDRHAVGAYAPTDTLIS